MATTLKRQISDSEKQEILKRCGRICFADGHLISKDETPQFDHIHAFSKGGTSEIENIAPMCQKHNLEKGTLSLSDFRTKLRIDAFFESGKALTLKHELEYLKNEKIISNYAESVYPTTDGDTVELGFCNKKKKFHLHRCPTTDCYYFYATLPVNVINSDDDSEGQIGLQPRGLDKKKVFELYRHLQTNTLLQPSIARLHKNKILVFDGQHKIAALLWGERKEFELKIYIEPDPITLNRTIVAAHDDFVQTKFGASTMVEKLGKRFGKELEAYRNLDDGTLKTELGFVRFLCMSEPKGVVYKRFRNFLFNAVLDKDNAICKLTSPNNKSTKEYPLTIDSLSKSLFAQFLNKEPTDDDMTGSDGKYFRAVEIKNVIQLCNILNEEIFFHYDSKKSDNIQEQLQIKRMISPRAFAAWSVLLREAISTRLKIYDYDKNSRIFYRILSEEQFEDIRSIVQCLVKHLVWRSPKGSLIDKTLSDGKDAIKQFLKEQGLTTEYLLGPPNK